jgi:hypothetical protein
MQIIKEIQIISFSLIIAFMFKTPDCTNMIVTYCNTWNYFVSSP